METSATVVAARYCGLARNDWLQSRSKELLLLLLLLLLVLELSSEFKLRVSSSDRLAASIAYALCSSASPDSLTISPFTA
jgi:hypothetical protein